MQKALAEAKQAKPRTQLVPLVLQPFDDGQVRDAGGNLCEELDYGDISDEEPAQQAAPIPESAAQHAAQPFTKPVKHTELPLPAQRAGMTTNINT